MENNNNNSSNQIYVNKSGNSDNKSQKMRESEKANEIIVSRVLSESDISRYNEMSPVVLTLKNINNQDPNIFSKLDSKITIRVLGGFDPNVSKKYNNDSYISKSSYSPKDIVEILNMFNDIEKNINPNWTDLQKSTYAYIHLLKNTTPENINEVKERSDDRPFAQIINSEGGVSSSSYAIVLKELVERLGIPCKYIENQKGNAWNEIMIDGVYYPADLYFDVINNQELLKDGTFDLKNFLSNKEFYFDKAHISFDNTDENKLEYPAIDHSEIQKSIEYVLNPENREVKIPDISLKSEEFKKLFNRDEIKSGDLLEEAPDIRLEITGQDSSSLKEDLLTISKYYPHVLDKVVLANTTSSHVDMQDIVDTYYEARKSPDGVIKSATELVIEASVPEDFDIDFSNVPEVQLDESEKIDDLKSGQKIAFVNKSTSQIKLADYCKSKISDNVNTIEFVDLDLNNFNIENIQTNKHGRKIVLKGIGSSRIADLGGLDDICDLSIEGIEESEFDSLMKLALPNANAMPKLFNLNVSNQYLGSRHFLDEIKNPNIIALYLSSNSLDNIEGIETLKNQLYELSVQDNELSIDDLKRVAEIKKDENTLLSYCLYNNGSLNTKVNNLMGDIISDDTFNYIDSYFKRTGVNNRKKLTHNNYSDITQRKKTMLKELLNWTFEEIPYYIEDAKMLRDVLPFINNPILVKDDTTFNDYLNNQRNYFEQNHLKNARLWLTKSQMDILIKSGKKIPQQIGLKIDTVADLDNDTLDNYKNECDRLGINLSGVNIFDDRCTDPSHPNLHTFDEIGTHTVTYKIDQYHKIRDSIDEITEGISSSMSDLEKFAVVYKRIASKIVYDHEVAEDAFTKEHAVYSYQKSNTSRNLYEGLTEQKGFDCNTNTEDNTLAYRTVCAGYADILKNCLEVAGVRAIIENGKALKNVLTNEKTCGHEWNKVQIDGKWYYADVCWDSGKNQYKNALKGINTFVNMGIKRNMQMGHYTDVSPGERFENCEKTDFDQAELKRCFEKVERGELPYKEIIIEDDPELVFNPTLDLNSIKQEYQDMKNDMYAKYYGDKDYEKKYNEVAERFKNNEVEVTKNGITYKTIQDYLEKEDDERFLLLDEYKNSLERMSKYDAGDTSVYIGTPDQISLQYEKDKEYIETRNHTFDQHKNTQKDLATLGKYGETLPYIQKQQGLVRNGIRAVANAGIFARNIVAPVYRTIGKYVAQPLHRMITGGKDASPYRNNPYHRFVARRDYFKANAAQNDQVIGKNHPIKNYVMSNVNAVLKYKVGNEKVLNAGTYDIQNNLKKKEIQKIGISFYSGKKSELERQILALENSINANGNAKNIDDARNALARKRKVLSDIDKIIVTASTTGKITTIQTDAVSQTQHDIASKEVNTYRVAAIKGVTKFIGRKFIGPKLKEWLLERSNKTISTEETYQTTIQVEKEVQDPSTIVPITEERPDFDVEVDDLISRSKDKTVKMYRSVSGGNSGEIDYTINGDEICSGIHFQDGSKWGTGFSDNVPIMTDHTWPTEFLDANNNLRTDITFNQIATAISEGKVSEEVLDNLTIQIKGKGWVYADELFEGVTKEVQVGEKIIEGAKHIDLVPEIVDRTRTVYQTVTDQKIMDALNKLGVSLDAIYGVDAAHNAAEILRKTNSDEKNNKKTPREYDYDDSELSL